LGQEDPEEPIPRSKLRALAGAFQCGELLAKGHVFQRDRLVPTARQLDGSEHDEDHLQHEPMVWGISAKINCGGRRSHFGEAHRS
jgi:hypothetical protein